MAQKGHPLTHGPHALHLVLDLSDGKLFESHTRIEMQRQGHVFLVRSSMWSTLFTLILMNVTSSRMWSSKRLEFLNSFGCRLRKSHWRIEEAQFNAQEPEETGILTFKLLDEKTQGQ